MIGKQSTAAILCVWHLKTAEKTTFFDVVLPQGGTFHFTKLGMGHSFVATMKMGAG